MKKQVISYIRFSSARQASGSSIQRQTQAVEDFIRSHPEYELSRDNFEDHGVSGWKGDNVATGALGKFLQLAQAGRFPEGTILFIENLDRLSRQKSLDAFNLFNQIIQAGIEIVTLGGKHYSKQSIEDNPFSLMEFILGSIQANEYSEKLSYRVKEGKRKSKEDLIKGKKKIISKRCPFWLTPEGGGFIENEKTEIVKRIFNMYCDGYGYPAIANKLNEEKIKPYGKFHHYTPGKISYVLKNPAVIGKFEFYKSENKRMVKTGEIIDDYYPVVIDFEKWMIAQQRLSKSKKGRRNPKTENQNLFRGLIKCSNCGCGLTVRSKKQPINNTRVTIIEGMHDAGCAGKTTYLYSHFEKRFLKAFLPLIFKVRFDDNKEDNKIETKKLELSKIESTIVSIMQSMEKAGSFPDIMMRKLSNLETEKKNLESEIKNLSQIQEGRGGIFSIKDKIEKWVTNIESLDMEDPDTRRMLSMLFTSSFEKIIIYPPFKMEGKNPNNKYVTLKYRIYGVEPILSDGRSMGTHLFEKNGKKISHLDLPDENEIWSVAG